MQFSFPSEHEIKEGVSLICAVKNRNENLDKALGTWIKHPEVDEIIIVDWDSDEPIEDVAKKHQDGRIKVAHVPNQPRWILSWAYNLAARLTSYSKILKLDADILLSDDFFQECELSPKSFFAGNLRKAVSRNDVYLNGQMFLYRKDFFSVNGFDERITTYGHDEDDLYGRLELGIKRITAERSKMGKLRWYSLIRFRTFLPPIIRKRYAKIYSNIQLKKQDKQKVKGIYERKDIPLGCMKHIEHSDLLRVAHQDVNPKNLMIEGKKNRILAKTPWSNAFIMKQFEISKLDENEFLCRAKDHATLSAVA